MSLPTPAEVEAETEAGCCQGCLSRERLRSLADECCVDGASEPYSDVFLSCFNLKIGEREGAACDGSVCEGCAGRLAEAERFRRQVVRSQELLRQVRRIKKEERDDADMKLDYSSDEPLQYKLQVKMDTAGARRPQGCHAHSIKERQNSDLKLDYSSDEPLQSKVEVKLDTDPLPPEGVSSDFWLKHEIFSDDFLTTSLQPKTKAKTKQKKQNKKADPKKPNREPKKKKKKQTKKALPMDVKTLSCQLCERSFDNIVILQRHMSQHFPTHLCDICGNVYRKSEHLKTHLKTHRTVQCTKCDKIMKEISFKKHMENRHMKKKRFYRCTVCNGQFPNISQKKTHMINEHGMDIGGKCSLCDKMFTFKSNLRLHIRAVHQKEENSFCQYCSKGFINAYALSRHMLKHTGIRNHVCPTCNKAYLKKDTLTAHMKIHDSVKDFVCSLCAKSFTYKCSLKGHMKNHHPHINIDS